MLRKKGHYHNLLCRRRITVWWWMSTNNFVLHYLVIKRTNTCTSKTTRNTTCWKWIWNEFIQKLRKVQLSNCFTMSFSKIWRDNTSPFDFSRTKDVYILFHLGKIVELNQRFYDLFFSWILSWIFLNIHTFLWIVILL